MIFVSFDVKFICSATSFKCTVQSIYGMSM